MINPPLFSNTIEGLLDAKGMRIGLIASRFNMMFVEKLVSGALDTLKRHGAPIGEQTLVWVPGAFEIPLVALKLAKTQQFHGLVALGVLLKGSTSHFDLVAKEVTSGLSKVALETQIPITHGVLALETFEQATERCGTKMGNQGSHTTAALIETISVLQQIRQKQ